MKYISGKIFWIFVVIVAATSMFDRGNCAKLYVLEENAINKVIPYSRLRRQTHPASTIAKLPTQDNNVFTPIVGPIQSNDQQFRQNNLDFSNSDTLVDYLLPPNPNAQFTSLNFQDPSANLQNIDSFFDVAPTSSASDTVNSFQPIQNHFPSSGSNFPNRINFSPQNTNADSVQSISFQNPPLPASPSLTFSSPTQSSNVNHFIQNKESSPLSRELNSINQFKNFDQFKPSNNFIKGDPIVLEQSASNQGKWDLGFDANDILAPPNPETARANDYDTINGNKYKKLNNIQPPLSSNNLPPPNTVLPPNNFSPPNNNFLTSNNLSPPSNQLNPPTTQFAQPNQFSQPTNQFQSNSQFVPNQYTPQQNFNQFNSLPPSNNQFISSNTQFSQQNTLPASNNQISVPNQFPPKDNFIVNDQTDVIWGTQKQLNNFNPTTPAPFLPTVPPTAQNSINFQNNGFNNGQNLQQFPSSQLNSDQIYQLPGNVNNQNYALDTPLTSQFDSFLPQGTVSDHSFFPVNENVRHFQRKRETENEDELEEEVEEPIYESKSQFKTGPVYSFVKTDKNGHFKWSVRHPSRR